MSALSWPARTTRQMTTLRARYAAVVHEPNKACQHVSTFIPGICSCHPLLCRICTVALCTELRHIQLLAALKLSAQMQTSEATFHTNEVLMLVC